MTTQNTPVKVDLWFDTLCPWTWVLSRWLLEVEKVRDVELTFHVLSVSLLNSGQEIPEQYRDEPEAFLDRMRRALAPVRVLAATAKQAGDSAVRDLYTAMGSRIHVGGDKDFENVIEQALAEVGLPAELAEAGRTDAYDGLLKDSTKAGMDPVGLRVGSPILHVDGAALFGPVMSRIPRGEQAGELFDSLAGLAAFPYVYELKRDRLEEPVTS
ncbi:DsbA family protein [Lentzea sp. NEAU-D13]|uniref:DsbA family protein n=1 Tax=Lentzea alba TaxID=2714351 RepID=A0A7C9VV75_9PSEU|nr:DsbA family protein [Lentzea alba]NGY63155.1 DsbA family protein [Lentzea alba]